MLSLSLILPLLLQITQPTGVTVRDEGAFVCRPKILDFVGTGVTATCPAGVGTLTISGSSAHTIQDEGVSLTQRTLLDFAGAGVVCADSGGTKTLCTIAGAGGTTHDILSATHTDTTAAAVVRGDIISGQAASPFWKRLALGSTGRYLRSDGTDIGYSAVAAAGAGACGANTVATTLTDNAAPTCTALTDAYIPNTITIDLATLATTATTANAGDSATAFFSSGLLEVAIGGTGSAPAGDDQLLVSSSTSAAAWKTLTICTAAGKALSYDTATNTFGCNTVSFVPTGTGFPHVTAGTLDAAAKLVDTADINANQVTFAKIVQASAAGVLVGRRSSSTGDFEEIVLGTNLTMGGATLNATAQTSALLSATHTDTLAAAVVRGDLIVGNATPAWSRLARGTASQQIRMNAGGTDPEWFTPAAGAANAVTISVAITSDGMFFSSIGVSAPWIVAGTAVHCLPHGGGATTVTAETLAVAGVQAIAANISAGLGFDLLVNNPNGLEGTVEFRCIGV